MFTTPAGPGSVKGHGFAEKWTEEETNVEVGMPTAVRKIDELGVAGADPRARRGGATGKNRTEGN